MTNQTRRKNTGEPGNGGKYAGHTPDEDTMVLTPALHEVDLSGTTVTLETSYLDDLTALPDGVDEPSVSWEYDAGQMQVYFRFGDEDITIWGNDEETFNSIVDPYDLPEPREPWGEDTWAVIEYATGVFHRIDGLAYEITKAIEAPSQSAVIAAALGKPASPAGAAINKTSGEPNDGINEANNGTQATAEPTGQTDLDH